MMEEVGDCLCRLCVVIQLHVTSFGKAVAQSVSRPASAAQPHHPASRRLSIVANQFFCRIDFDWRCLIAIGWKTTRYEVAVYDLKAFAISTGNMAQQPTPELSQGYEQNPHTRLADLCTPKLVDDGKTWSPIEDDAFEEISDLLLNIGHKESWSRRPRTYAVLRMMNSVPHMDAFETYGLNDTAFPYRTKRDLPPELQSPDMSELFLWYQKYVLCDVCDLEKEKEGRHISVKDGERLFRWHAKLGRGQSG
jgi:hypothetical protein